MTNAQQLRFMLRFGCELVGILALAFGIGTYLKFGTSDDIMTRNAIVFSAVGTVVTLIGWLLRRWTASPAESTDFAPIPTHPDGTGWRSWHFYCAAAVCIAVGLGLCDLGNLGKGGYDWKALAGIALVSGGIALFFSGRRRVTQVRTPTYED